MNAIGTNQNETLRIFRGDEVSRADDFVGLYLIKNTCGELLSAEQEIDLFKQMESGLPGAKDRLITANLGLVVSTAKKYAYGGQKFDDFVQEGRIGLLKAVEKFDYRKGNRFSTYAMWWIRQTITRSFAHERTIRLPANAIARVNRMNRVSSELTQELGRKPSNKEIAETLGWTAKKLNFVMKAVAQEPVRLKVPKSDEDDSPFLYNTRDENAVDPAARAVQTLLREDITEAVSRLPSRERVVIRMRFGLDDGYSHTLEEVGRRIKVSREGVRQLEKNALRRLRRPKYSHKLKDYLEC
jgi:RNA polymerase primary sigma factor